ncbi:hypothetical protein [Rahnella victoriana]|uniref:hypothetical protein n=1 Tax=Rahnella victoriana TaxID=1510570 RepID=UPI001E6331FA|nr:hypothetical protein [Rahnella victoriana]UHM93635.1 hypothetical protein J9880_24605 [Rahnella victoriana]
MRTLSSLLLIPLSLCLVTLSCAAADVKLDTLPAMFRQTCGKSVEIHMAALTTSNAGHVLLGLKNRETGGLDLFMSDAQMSETLTYAQYTKVFFDSLSRHYVAAPEPLHIIWGAAHEDGKEDAVYRLALGSHVYDCGPLEKLPDNTVNRLYGDPDHEVTE